VQEAAAAIERLAYRADRARIRAERNRLAANARTAGRAALGDEAADPDYRHRYRNTATSLGFEGT
jgi:hypothetical protein